MRGPRRPPRRREPEHRINERIKHTAEVRLTHEPNEEDNGVYPIAEALKRAEERNLDLVEVAPKARPPVCRIIDYSKFRYEQKKKEKEIKSKQHTSSVREIRFGPNTADHDFNFKLKHAEKFLQDGDKVKAYVTFHGRSIVHKDRGSTLLKNFAEALEEDSKIELGPRMEGKRMFLILAPKNK